ncbi:MAG: FAD-dependent thymidylate synthase [Candidatus Dojkabacteria bacterium]
MDTVLQPKPTIEQIKASLPLYFKILEETPDGFKVRGGMAEDAPVFFVTFLPENEEEELLPLRFVNEATGKAYELSVSKKVETGIRIFKLKNLETRIEINYFEFNEDLTVGDFLAWVGSRTSRSALKYIDIAKEIRDKKIDPGEKLKDFFVKYGHASVAGMSTVVMGIDNLSIFQAMNFFNKDSIGNGQEFSFRYNAGNFPEIIFDARKVEVIPVEQGEMINDLILDVQHFQEGSYRKWRDIVTERHKQFIEGKPEKILATTLSARTFDVIRNLLPLGLETKVFYVGSVRDWLAEVVQLKQSVYSSNQELAGDIEVMLKMGEREEVVEWGHPQTINAGLLKYSEGTDTISVSLENLKIYMPTLPGFQELLDNSKSIRRNGVRNNVTTIEDLKFDGTAFEHLLTIFPQLNILELQKYLKALPDEYKVEIGRIIFSGHDHHDLMRILGDIRSYISWWYESSFSNLRDFNRHRAFSRFMQMLETQDIDYILDCGFNDNFQMEEADYLKDLKPEWNEDFLKMYRKIRTLNDKLKEMNIDESVRREIIVSILPLGHQATLMMSGPDTQEVYFAARRGAGKPKSGDFTYMKLTEMMADILRSKNPYMRHLLEEFERINPNSFKQWNDRS